MGRTRQTTQSIEKSILKRVRGLGRGAVVTPGHFFDLASRETVDSALSRLVAAGRLRRIVRGLYDLPRRNPRLGPLAPSVDAVVKAVADRDRVRVQPTGAYAANKLGLTTQVPMRVSFLTDGPQREFRLGKLRITFRHTTPRNMATAGRASGLAIQALRWLGKGNVDDGVVRTLRKTLDAEARREIAADLRYAPAWIAQVLRRVTEEEDSR